MPEANEKVKSAEEKSGTVPAGSDSSDLLCKPQHDHRCFCGTTTCVPHEIGRDGCERYMTEPPDLTEATLFTYEQQRGYFQHPCGCWSRWPESVNSLDA